MCRSRNLIIFIFAGIVAVSCGGGDAPKSTETTPADKVPMPITAKTVDASMTGGISGGVRYTGKPGRKVRIRMNADPNCSAKHSSPVYAQDLQISEDGGLKDVFLWVKVGLEDYNFQPPSEVVTLDQSGCVYVPHVLGIQSGQELNVLNSDDTTHNINPSPSNNRDWNISQAPASQPIVKKFARTEVMIPVKCNVHPWMKSYIGVVPHPYFVVTGSDGRYSLENLPPGEYTLEVWHERLGAQEQTITVATGQISTIDFEYGG